jgi:hypothetical protein
MEQENGVAGSVCSDCRIDRPPDSLLCREWVTNLSVVERYGYDPFWFTG